jgi:hypothetical protein
MKQPAKRIVVLTVAVMATLGCAAAVRWEKSGASEAERGRDETECASRASRESTVPSAQTVGTSTGTPADPQRTRVLLTDPAVFDECMKTRGYERVLPARPPG